KAFPADAGFCSLVLVFAGQKCRRELRCCAFVTAFAAVTTAFAALPAIAAVPPRTAIPVTPIPARTAIAAITPVAPVAAGLAGLAGRTAIFELGTTFLVDQSHRQADLAALIDFEQLDLDVLA